MALALGLTVGLSWLLRGSRPGPLDKIFRRLQLVSAGLYSLSHGANDAQKTMGIIVSLLVASQADFANQTGLLHHLYVPTADNIPALDRDSPPTRRSRSAPRWADGAS